MSESEQHVYFFGDEATEGDATKRALLGGKGANLAEMCRIGMPVPPGFTIATSVCRRFYEENQTVPSSSLRSPGAPRLIAICLTGVFAPTAL